MKSIFKDAGTGILPPDFYFGNIVEENGIFKLEWKDPDTGTVSLLTEQDLRLKETESRLCLCSEGSPAGSDGWKRQRNINYSAEYGLAALQEHKQAHGKPLETAYRPVVPSFPFL